MIDDYYARNGYKLYDGKCGARCFDGAYEKNGKIYINEVKPMGENGALKLTGENPGTKLDVQMTDGWMDRNQGAGAPKE